MRESRDGLTVYQRIIGNGMFNHCNCGSCKLCRARKAVMIAQSHLLEFLGDKLPETGIRVTIVLLNPGNDDPSWLINLLRIGFGDTVKTIVQAAKEFRQCETEEEALEVAKRFPYLVAAA